MSFITLPKIDKQYGKQYGKKNAIEQLSQDLINAIQIPSKENTIRYLEENLSFPTRGVFYDYGTLLNKKKLSQYVEFDHFKPGVELPEEIGEFHLNPIYILKNERHFIIPILQKSSNAGYDIAKIDSKGICFYVNKDDLLEKSRQIYDNFFLSKEKVLQEIANVVKYLINQNGDSDISDIYRIKIGGSSFNHIRLTYPNVFSRFEMSRIRYELQIHYGKMNYWIKFFYDENLAKNNNNSTVLKIHFELKEILPQIYPLFFNNY